MQRPGVDQSVTPLEGGRPDSAGWLTAMGIWAAWRLNSTAGGAGSVDACFLPATAATTSSN